LFAISSPIPTIVSVFDKLTFAGNLAPIANNSRYAFVKADITDAPPMKEVFGGFRPNDLP
jgi:dTDP-glucose 4,6-dehydratase